MTVREKAVLVTGSSLVPDDVVGYIERRGYRVRRVRRDDLTAAELDDALDGVAGYLIGGEEELLDGHLDRAGALQALGFVGTDAESYVPGWRRARERGLALVTAPGANARAVAEFTMLLVLSMCRPYAGRIATGDRPAAPLPEPGRELRGRSIGIIGLGRVGAAVARIAGCGFGMRVRYHAPRRSAAAEHGLDVCYAELDRLLADSDVVTLHRPGPLPGEAPMLGSREFAVMAPGAILVNTAHPGLVDLDSLLGAVRTRGISAALDATVDSPAARALTAFGPDRFLAVPTMAYHTREANLAASMRTAVGVCDALDRGVAV